jgi:hypothetical protein
MQGSSTASTATPKRVDGGIGVVIKKKRKRTAQSQSCVSNSESAHGIPGILTSVPDNSRALSSEAHERAKQSKPDDEFGGDNQFHDSHAINDTFVCLQTYTRPTNGMASETCAYCPIFTISDAERDAEPKTSSSTHAAPFLPRLVLVHLSSNHAKTYEDIKQLAAANEIRLLQLHGTAIAKNGLGWRGDGNDDADVAVMETCAYEIASRMALEAHLVKVKAEFIHQWFVSMLLPNFSGTWILASALESFIESVAIKGKTCDTTKSLGVWTVGEMNSMVKDLILCGLLLPRRGLSLNGGEGYWFSLPGLGKSAKSIADGRLSILRRIQSSKFKEKKRSTLEHEVGRSVKKDKNVYVQAGKFLVLDLLSKNLVYIQETCTSDQFVRIK